MAGFKKGGKGGPGRPKGCQNKATVAAKEAIQLAFDDAGGVEALAEWVKASEDNRKVFYSQMWTKLLPLQVAGDAANPMVHRIERVIVDPAQN